MRGTGAMLSLHRTHSVPWLPCPPRPAANSLCGHTGLFGCAHRGWASVHVTSPQPVPCMASSTWPALQHSAGVSYCAGGAAIPRASWAAGKPRCDIPFPPCPPRPRMASRMDSALAGELVGAWEGHWRGIGGAAPSVPRCRIHAGSSSAPCAMHHHIPYQACTSLSGSSAPLCPGLISRSLQLEVPRVVRGFLEGNVVLEMSCGELVELGEQGECILCSIPCSAVP